ncbi:MAG: TlpA family protein disulfide reductase [Bacteroidales bacterium]|nr:TlpA family protein disulfide reductase [Bacteroidales bacterium]
MKRLILCLAILISAAAAAQVPSVTVEDSKGESFNTKELLKEGTPMIISFWSTSCKPCIRELDAVYDALPDWLEEADFRVVAVSTDDSRLLAKAKSFAEGRGWGEEYTLLFDKNQDFMRAMNVSVVPHVFVVDANGKIVYSHTSYVPGNELELFEAIKKSQKKKK